MELELTDADLEDLDKFESDFRSQHNESQPNFAIMPTQLASQPEKVISNANKVILTEEEMEELQHFRAKLMNTYL